MLAKSNMKQAVKIFKNVFIAINFSWLLFSPDKFTTAAWGKGDRCVNAREKCMNAGFGVMNAGLKFVQPLYCDQ
jgi:hypothetical protein